MCGKKTSKAIQKNKAFYKMNKNKTIFDIGYQRIEYGFPCCIFKECRPSG